MPDTTCQRCARPLHIAPRPGSQARLLKRAATAQGYCINCAVHDWLRHTYPANLVLARMAHPQEALRLPHVQAHFVRIMQAGQADANPAEIDWDTLATHWDLPFPTRLRRSARNPMDEADLARDAVRPPRTASRQPDPLEGVETITSFEQLNRLEPGLGDALQQTLRQAFGREDEAPLRLTFGERRSL